MSDPDTTAVIPISSARRRRTERGAGGPGAYDSAGAYAALRTGAVVVVHADRDLWTFRGPRARETLTGLVTNDVAGLVAGLGCYAAALTAKGRIIADVRIFATDSAATGDAAGWLADVAAVVDVPPRAADGWGALVRKFVNPRVAPYRREHDRLRAIGVYGLGARDAIAEAFGAPPAALAALALYAHAIVHAEGTPILVAHVPDAGVAGFLIVTSVDAAEIVVDRLLDASPGAVRGDAESYALAKLEAGYPEWGIDIDETTIPQEANFDELAAISYTKGCYTGQEVVARIHFRGHVNRHLRGLTYAAEDEPIPTGAELVDDAGKVVGDVRSSRHSPRLGGVAIGMVRREVPLGAALRARWPAGADIGQSRGVTVGPLPFPADPRTA